MAAEAVTMLKRRDFLRLSCAAAVATSSGVLTAAAWSSDSLPIGESAWLSVGFAEESEVADAQALYGGDASFLRHGARLSVSASRSGLNIALNALYGVEIDGIRRIVPFSVASESSVPVRFVIPVDPDEGVAFELIAGARDRRILRFTVNPRDGAIPLRRGTYVLAVSDRHVAPDWRSLEMICDRGFPVLKSRDEREVPFLPLFLTFDAVSSRA